MQRHKFSYAQYAAHFLPILSKPCDRKTTQGLKGRVQKNQTEHNKALRDLR